MALPNITLAQFNKIASGEFNAGLVDFKTDEQGNVLNQLTKVNNHVHKIKLNNVVLSPERVLEVKEAFINALRAGGVKQDAINQIRRRLGIDAEVYAGANVDDRAKMLEARFKPLSRHEVRAILNDYAKYGRGFTEESAAAISLHDAEKALKATNLSGSDAEKRDRVNTAAFNAAKASVSFDITDAISILSTDVSFAKACAAIDTRFNGTNAVNEQKAAKTAVKNQFMTLFGQAMTLLDANVNETGSFTFFGMKAKLVKDPDGKLHAILGEGTLATKVNLRKTVTQLVNDLIARAALDVDVFGADNVKLMLDKVFTRDVEGFLTGEDRTSLTRSFATVVLMKKTGSPGQMKIAYDEIMGGNYNTGTLVDVATLALDGKVATKADLDRLHAELVKNNAGLDDATKEMLSRVAGMPIVKSNGDNGRTYEMTVENRIVADIAEVVGDVQAPKAPPVGVVPREELAMTAADVKNFIADLVYSDDTMVSDVVVNLPGESMRSFFADDRRVAALAKIVQAPEIIDTAVSEDIAPIVKDSFGKMKALLAEEWAKAYENETLDEAKVKPDFLDRFLLFIRDKGKLPGIVLAKFEPIIQNMANKGCVSIQTFINKVFKIDTNAAKNAQGGFTVEPYAKMKPEEIKAALDNKNLNQILDDAATDSASPGQIALFKQVLSDYFTSMTKSGDKRSAFAAALRYADTYNLAGLQGDELKTAKAKSDAKFTGAILKGTSPLLQKMMQGLPRNVLGEFAEALDDMKSRLAPIPRKLVQAHLMKMIDDSNGKIKSIKLMKSLGAASVGEAFLCEFRYDDNGEEKKEDMVVKIMRHDAEEKVKREAEVFSAAAEKIGPGMLKTWQGQLAQYMTEFDFMNEAQNVNEGAALYDVEHNPEHPYRAIAPNVGSMKISPIVAPSKNAMVCTLADGETADKSFGEMRGNIQRSLSPVFERDAITGRLKWNPQTRKPIFKNGVGEADINEARVFCIAEYDRLYQTQMKLQQAASVWFSEAILGSGKFHGDAHAGNLMVDSYGNHITFIDFGNLYELKTHYETDEQGDPVMETVTVVNENGLPAQVERQKVKLDERVELLRLILGATLRDRDFFMQGFENLLSDDGKAAFKANKEKVVAILDSILAKGEFSFDVCYRLQGALSELQKLGLELPPQINCFVLSMTRFQNTIGEMNAIMNQTRAAIDALKDCPPPDKLLAPDPLDLFSEIQQLQTTEAGRKLVEMENVMYYPDAPEGDFSSFETIKVPAFVLKMDQYGSFDGGVDSEGSEYRTAITDSIKNAADKVVEVRRIAGLFIRHFDPDNMPKLISDINSFHLLFERQWNAATTDEEKANAIKTFVDSFAGAVRQQMQTCSNTAQKLYAGRFPVPNSFAKVVMGTLFNGAAAAEKIFDDNFSTIEKLQLGNDSRKIATGELNVSTIDLGRGMLPAWLRGDAPTADQLIMEAIIRDTERMGGDKSYQLDVGV